VKENHCRVDEPLDDDDDDDDEFYKPSNFKRSFNIGEKG
jgi:hypothetical protein